MVDYWKNVPSETMFDFEAFYARMAMELPDGCRIVEVGVSNGRSLLFLASHLHALGKSYRLVGVDSMAYGGQEQRNTIIGHLIAAGLPDIELLEMSSLDASCKFPDGYLDFVFLDSSHQYEQTKAEIVLWSRKVKDDHIVAGHDAVGLPEVAEAVHEMILPDRLNIEPTRLGSGVWWTRKLHVPKQQPATASEPETP